MDDEYAWLFGAGVAAPALAAATTARAPAIRAAACDLLCVCRVGGREAGSQMSASTSLPLASFIVVIPSSPPQGKNQNQKRPKRHIYVINHCHYTPYTHIHTHHTHSSSKRKHVHNTNKGGERSRQRAAVAAVAAVLLASFLPSFIGEAMLLASNKVTICTPHTTNHTGAAEAAGAAAAAIGVVEATPRPRALPGAAVDTQWPDVPRTRFGSW